LGTVHSAKGLEWPILFLIGVSDQFFPYQNPWLTSPVIETSPDIETSSILRGSDARIEEERRLLYVGLTRAQNVAHLSFVGNPSPFISEWNKNN
jgi:superfamily I DNA/RNA helicase